MARSRRGNAGVPPRRLGEEEPESESESESEGEAEQEADGAMQEGVTNEDDEEAQFFIRTTVQNTLQQLMPTLLAQLGTQSQQAMAQDSNEGDLPPNPTGIQPPPGAPPAAAAAPTPATTTGFAPVNPATAPVGAPATVPPTGTPATTPAARETPYAGRRLNLADKIDHQLFNNALKPLNADAPFNGKDHFATFIHRLTDKCRTLHCENIFRVQTTARGIRNLLIEYGEINLLEVQNAAKVRWATADWDRQASYIIGRSLLSSVTSDFHMRLMLKSAQYTVPAHNEIDGPALFKVICTMVNPAGRNNTRILLTKLEKFRPAEVQNNIVEFNSQFLTLKMEVSAAQGGQGYIHGDHLYNILMDAYESVNQDDFNDWVRHRNNMGRVTYDNLMSLAEDRYNTLVQEGKWDLPSQQDQFLAFAASTSKAIASIKRVVDSRKKGKEKRAAGTTPNKKQKRGPDKNKDGKKIPTNAEYKAWCAKAPKKGDEDNLVWHMTPSGVERQFNWCKHHNRMVVYKDRHNRIHTSATCALAPENREGDGSPAKKKELKVKALKGARDKPKRLKALQAQIHANLQDLEALQAEIGDDASSEENSSDDEEVPSYDSAEE